jgi:TolA-binding protein
MGKLDAKIADLENLINTVRSPAPPPPSGGQGGDNPGAAGPGAALGGSTGAAPPQGLQAGSLYTTAYSDQLAGKYDIAFQEFTEYLKYFGSTSFAPNAQYYIADIYFRKADYTNALSSFDAVLEKYEEGPKTPDARYMKAVCLMKLGKNDSAAREFRDIYSRYSTDHPDIAAKAKAQLRDMGLSVGTTAKRRR